MGAGVSDAETSGGELREAEEAAVLSRGADQGQQEGQERGLQDQGTRQGWLRLKQQLQVGPLSVVTFVRSSF